MKYICRVCEEDVPCICEVQDNTEAPFGCLYALPEEKQDAEWQEVTESDYFEMRGFGKTKIEGTKIKKYVICDKCRNNDETCSLCNDCKNGSMYEPKQSTCYAAEPQPEPTGTGSKVLPEFVKDVYARADSGHEKYGTMLRTGNGRDALMDAYQECLDMGMYLKQAIMERDSWEDKIRQWADDRLLYQNTTPFAQLTKLLEESLEWHTEVQRGDREAEKLEIGDMLVVLTNIANSRGVSLQECGWMAYEKIKDRTGHIESGSFVKD
jgi:NTP pyrophosphatase (non-canonical NTP hydrolase)